MGVHAVYSLNLKGSAMTSDFWAHFTIPHTPLFDGATRHSSVTLKLSEAATDGGHSIFECFVKAIGAYMAWKGHSPDEVKTMSKEEVYDQLIDCENNQILEEFLARQGISVESWEIIETDNSGASLDEAFRQAKERSLRHREVRPRPRIRVIE